MSKEFALIGDDPNIKVGHQDEDSLVTIVSPDTDVVQLASVAQGDGSPAVDVVAPHSGLGEHGLTTNLDCGFVEGTPRAHWPTVARLVWSLFVVVENEAVDARLQLFNRR